MKEEFNNSAADRIEGLFARLRKVPEGEAVVIFLEKNGVKIDLQEDPVDWAASTATITNVIDGHYSYINPKIILKAGLSDDNLLQAMIHETEHLNQHLSGVGNPDRILSQEEYILFYRAAEADAQAVCTDISWRLKQSGDAGPWNEARNVGFANVCDAFERMALADPASLEDGRARRVAFDAWFDEPERLAGYNKATVENMIPFLARGREIFSRHNMSEAPLDNDWVDKMDALANQPYLKLMGYDSLLRNDKYRKDLDTRPIGAAPKPPNEGNENAISVKGVKPPQAA
ncbi:MAG: hypothetical protein PW788_04465 [Micavibrio sp.]|nr:hypothetical protein [Micavibrio sp.]